MVAMDSTFSNLHCELPCSKWRLSKRWRSRGRALPEAGFQAAWSRCALNPDWGDAPYRTRGCSCGIDPRFRWCECITTIVLFLMNISRRDFLKTSTLVAGFGVLSPSIARAAIPDAIGAPTVQPPEKGWEFNRQTFGNPWEMWTLHVDGWQSVELPHCFNHYDACDPDVPAYRGQGWYRRKISPQNPFAG